MSGCSKCGTSSRSSHKSTSPKGRKGYDKKCGEKECTQVTKWTALPVYECVDLPEDLDLIGGSNREGRAWRIPATRFLVDGKFNTTQLSVSKGTADIDVPYNQVIPVNKLGPNLPWEKALANAEDPLTIAQYIAVGNDPNNADNMVLQVSGFVTFPRVHKYAVGKTYYLSQTNAGEVIGTKPTSGIVQPLFTVVDELTIAINIGV